MKKQNRNPNKSSYELNRDQSKNKNILQNIKHKNGFNGSTSVISKSNYKPKFIIKENLQSHQQKCQLDKQHHLNQNQHQNMHPSQTFTNSPMGNSQMLIGNSQMLIANKIGINQHKDYALIRTRRSQKVCVPRTYENSQVNFYNAEQYQPSELSRDQDFNASIQKSKYSVKNEANMNYKLMYLQAKKQLQVRTAYFNEAVGLWTEILNEMDQNLQQQIDDGVKLNYMKSQCRALIQTFEQYTQN